MEYESIILKDEITVRKIYTIHYFVQPLNVPGASVFELLIAAVPPLVS